MNLENKVALEVDQLTEKERKKEIDFWRNEEKNLKSEIENKNSVLYRLATEPSKNVIQYYADVYYHLFDLGDSKVHPTEIANFLVQELKDYVHFTTVYAALGSKFKSHTANPNSEEKELNALGNPNESSSLNIEAEKENEAWITAINNQIDFLRSFRNKLSNSHFMSLLPDDIKKQCKETLQNIETITNISNAIGDDRQSTPLEMQHLLASAFIIETNNFAAGIYISLIKDFGANRSKKARENLKKLADAGEKIIKDPDTMTSKQAMKIILGHISKVAELYDPKNRNEALLCGYHGTQCSNTACRSWRTYLDFDGPELSCRCYACYKTTERGIASKCLHCYLPFYDEVVQVMKQNAVEIAGAVVKTNCINPSCKAEVYLPIKKLIPILVRQK